MSVNRTATGIRVRRLTIAPRRLTGNPVPKPSTRPRVARIVRRVHRATRQVSW